MIMAECIDELADFAGIKPQIAAITERAMQGELDFDSALRERVLLLRDLSRRRDRRMPRHPHRADARRAGAGRDAQGQGLPHRAGDRRLPPVRRSGGRAAGLRAGGGQPAGGGGRQADRRAGRRRSPTARSSRRCCWRKRRGWARARSASPPATAPTTSRCCEAATYGIAYRAKPKARAAADGWVDRGDLTGVLELLGIPRDEWVWE